MTLTLRDIGRKLSPTWLRGYTPNNPDSGIAERLLWVAFVHLEILGDACTQGQQNAFPGALSNQSLALLGHDRRIPRGLLESEEQYAARLVRWLDDHATRGNPYGLLAQLYVHYADPSTGLAFQIQLIYRNGRRFTMAPDGSVVMDDLPGWHEDAPLEAWARYTLIYSTIIELPLEGNTESDLRLIPAAWQPAHAKGRLLLRPAGAGLWNVIPPEHETWNDDQQWNTVVPLIALEI